MRCADADGHKSYIRKHKIYRRGISTLPPICQQIALYTLYTTFPSSLRGNARNVHAVIWMMLLVVVVLQSSQSFREKNLNTFFHFHSWLETFLHKRSHTSTSTAPAARSTMRLCTVAVLMSNTAAERARENHSRRNPTLLFFCYLYKTT